MLRYTGHPLVDVGVATITAFAEKRDPSKVTESDLERFAEFMERVYFGKRWAGMMSISFMNSPYTQPKIGQEKKEGHRQAFIYGFRAGPPAGDRRCTFCGQLTATRAFRQHVPLLTGEEVVNFFPWGQAGLPVCGICALAVQAFLLGSVKCGGRALFVHSDDNVLTLEFARRFLTENRRFLTLGAVTEEEEKAQNLRHPRTYFVARLREIEQERQEAEEAERPHSVTVYHLTNYGTNPDVDIYHLPCQVLTFVRRVSRAPHGYLWQQIERRAWELAVEKTKSKRTTLAAGDLLQHREEPGRVRNYLYEDLFDLPRNAARFVRTYFLRRAYSSRFEEDPRRHYSLQRELELVSWTLAEIFLKEVMNMDKYRIETIKQVADRLAECIQGDNNRKLFRALWMSSRYGDLRLALVRESIRRTQSGKEPLLTFDEFVTIFEFGEDSQRPDWNLARDLVLIRVIEQLYQNGWFDKHRDLIAEEEVAEPGEAVTD